VSPTETTTNLNQCGMQKYECRTVGVYPNRNAPEVVLRSSFIVQRFAYGSQPRSQTSPLSARGSEAL
jgi:hypothetical protein